MKMIGLAMRAMGFGGGGGLLTGLILSLFAVCAVWGLCRCASCRLRDCACCKRCLRFVGQDTFDAFEVMILVHEVTYTAREKISTSVRIRAGDQVAETTASTKGNFQQPLSMLIEQGCDFLDVDIMDGSKVLASTSLDVLQVVLKPKEKVLEKSFALKQKSKLTLNPRVKLSIHLEGGNDVESNILSELHLSAETDIMMRQQLQKLEHSAPSGGGEKQVTDLDILVQGCAGPLETFGRWGIKDDIFVRVLGPPDRKKFMLCMWSNVADGQEGKKKPDTEIDLLKIVAVHPDPKRLDLFKISYFDSHKVKQGANFRQVDRNRDAWIEMLQILIKKVHEAKQAKKDQGQGESSSKKGK